MALEGLIGERLIRLGRDSSPDASEDFRLRYLLLIIVIVIGALYAAPNLFAPDFALQLRSTSSDGRLPQRLEARVVEVLASRDIAVKSTQFSPERLLVRFDSGEDQLRAKSIMEAWLNRGETRYVIALNLASTTPAWLENLGGKPMSLGLDLSGGIHFLLEVDLARAVEDRLEADAENLRRILREQRLRYESSDEWLVNGRLEAPFLTEETRDAAEEAIRDAAVEYEMKTGLVKGRPGLLLSLRSEEVDEIRQYAMSQNLSSLRNRVNELGVSEPLVQAVGGSRIIVDLPGVQDSADAKRILNKFANLEFRLVAPPDASLARSERHEYEGREVVLERSNIVTGDRVTNAIQNYDAETGLPQVSIDLDGVGGELMNQATRNNVGNQMGIVFIELVPEAVRTMVDGEESIEYRSVENRRVINVATIQSALGYRFRITGLGFNEARDLALLLRAGALAVPMYIVEERTVGASLGQENIERGALSMLIGMGLVVVFMIGYYKLFGLAAVLALGVNLMLLAAIMSVLGATLTLPGIAGIVLTVGMAVDANVLIFSRIREELARSPPRVAIRAGFERAFLTILDANVTTFFVAIILLTIGSGPIKGFAVTLSIGIVTSVFTAVVGTRSLIHLIYGRRSLSKLAI